MEKTNILHPGDRPCIPNPRIHELDCAPNRSHKLRTSGAVWIPIAVVGLDHKPVSGVACRFLSDGIKQRERTTNGEGLDVPDTARAISEFQALEGIPITGKGCDDKVLKDFLDLPCAGDADAAGTQGEPWLGVRIGGKRVFIPIGLGRIDGRWSIVR